MARRALGSRRLCRTQPPRLRARAARGRRLASHRSRHHGRALPRRARRLARLHPHAVRRARARPVGARDRGAARGREGDGGARALERRRHRAALPRRRRAAADVACSSRNPRRCETRSSSSSTARRCSPASSARTPRARCYCRVGAPAARTPLWVQRLRAQTLLAVARGFPSFPILLETYRTCLQDVFDLPALEELLAQVRRREVRVDDVETRSASPFARNLVFAYTAAFLYEDDNPVAERRAHALTLDRDDAARAARPRGAARAARPRSGRGGRGGAPGSRAGISSARRGAAIRLVAPPRRSHGGRGCGARGGRRAHVARDARGRASRRAGANRGRGALDRCARGAALYRDALRRVAAGGVCRSSISSRRPMRSRVWSRVSRARRGPFATQDLASRYALPIAQAELALANLEARGKLVAGDFRPGGSAREWCDARCCAGIRRRTLARLRGEVAPVESRGAGALPAGVAGRRRGRRRRRSTSARSPRGHAAAVERARARDPAGAREATSTRARSTSCRRSAQLVWVGCRGTRRIATAASRSTAASARRCSPTRRSCPRALAARAGAARAARARAAHSSSPSCSRRAAAPPRRTRSTRSGSSCGRGSSPTTRSRRCAASARAHRRDAARSRAGAAGRWSQRRAATRHGERRDLRDAARPRARAACCSNATACVAREAFAQEHWRGGFGGVYPVLRAMEEAGKVRRGHFVDGLSGRAVRLCGRGGSAARIAARQ